jgi:hypothetical protein
MAPRGGKLNQSQRRKKTGNGTVGWTDGTLEENVGVLGTLLRRPAELAPSDEPTTHILVASDELQSWNHEDTSTGWIDGPLDRTVGLSNANQDIDAPRRSLQHRMNRRLGQGEASVYPTVAW